MELNSSTEVVILYSLMSFQTHLTFFSGTHKWDHLKNDNTHRVSFLITHLKAEVWSCSGGPWSTFDFEWMSVQKRLQYSEWTAFVMSSLFLFESTSLPSNNHFGICNNFWNLQWKRFASGRIQFMALLNFYGIHNLLLTFVHLRQQFRDIKDMMSVFIKAHVIHVDQRSMSNTEAKSYGFDQHG